MLKSSRIVTLNLGSQTLGLAEFQRQPHGGIILLNYQLCEVPTHLGSEEIRHREISTRVQEMMAELGIRHENVNYSVRAQSVFTRFVRLPMIDDEEIERIIAFEAQQNVPFPIEEVVWNYQIVGGGGDEQIEVMLVAIKADLLEQINRAVEKTGLRTRVVDVAPMALYNAFRYNYSDLSGCSLLVDLGVRSTNLLFVEPQKFFSRSIPIGSSTVMAAVSNEFGRSFDAPPEEKRDAVVTFRNPHQVPSASEVAPVSKLMPGTMTRIHAEMIRSISHYRAQHRGRSPDRLFLCGGIASPPRMRQFFSEKFELPVEYFNPLRNVAFGPSVPVDQVTRSAHLLGELVGLALRSVRECPISVDLRPAAVARRQELESRLPVFIMAAAAVLVAFLGWGTYYARASQVIRAGVEKIKRMNEPMRAAEAKIEKLRQQVTKLDDVTTPLVAAINDRSFWTQILDDLNARLPKENIWVTELIPMSAGKAVGPASKTITENLAAAAGSRLAGNSPAVAPAIDSLLLRGLYLSNPMQQDVVVDYFKNLVGSSFFKVDPKNQSRAIKSTIPNDAEWAFPYELRLELSSAFKIP